MNVRKPVDYSAMFASLNTLMAADLPQMELYCEIGRLVSERPEKGAAVAAAEYLNGAYPDAAGFSPRNLRRMREFSRTYENTPAVLAMAMTIGWTQNVVILEAELTIQERAWYIRAVRQFGWSKVELQQKIEEKAHCEIILDFEDEVCYTKEKSSTAESNSDVRQTEKADRLLLRQIGQFVGGRPKKGAAVMAAEYLHSAYPDVSGFSPRNLRRVREFYRIYEATPEVLAEAMTIGWTQNVVILEADLRSSSPSGPPQTGRTRNRLCRQKDPPREYFETDPVIRGQSVWRFAK